MTISALPSPSTITLSFSKRAATYEAIDSEFQLRSPSPVSDEENLGDVESNAALKSLTDVFSNNKFPYSGRSLVESFEQNLNVGQRLLAKVCSAWNKYLAQNGVRNQGFFSDLDARNAHSAGLVLTDANRSIVHVNADFELLSGYSLNDSLGRNASFLQGKLTDENAVNALRAALKERRPCQVMLINYRKDGQPFWNLLTIAPLLNASGNVERWFGIQVAANESWFLDRPLPLFPWTHYPLPTIAIKKNKRPAVESASSEEEAVAVKVKNYGNSEIIEEIGATPKVTLEMASLSFIAETLLPTRHGRFRIRAYRQLDENKNATDVEIMVIVHGRPEDVKENVAVRVHDACFTSEVLHSLKCDCREQLEYSMKYIREVGHGMVIYLPQEGRGIGLSNKIKAYSMQELGLDTVDANRILGFPDDNRAYNAVPAILIDMGVQSVKLLSNNTRKFGVLRDLGVKITGRIPVLVLPTFLSEAEANPEASAQVVNVQLTKQVADGAPAYVKNDTKYAENYVKAKIARMGHMHFVSNNA